MTEPADNMLSRVRKLLAKAEDPACTPEEAAALNDKAAELIAKYGVDRAMLAASDPTSDTVGDRVIVVAAPFALDKTGLLATIAKHMGARSVRRKEWSGTGYVYQMHLFGFGADLERIDVLYTSLLVQASFGIAAATAPPWESLAAYRRSWLNGFTAAVSTRLQAAQERAAAQHDQTRDSGPSVALVLADRSALVDRRVTEQYPRLRNAPTRTLSGSGRARGYAAGERADLGTTRLGQQRRDALAR